MPTIMGDIWSNIVMMASTNTAITCCRDRSMSCSASWQPQTSGQYAGTCITLTVLTMVLRVLVCPAVWDRRALQRRGNDGAAAADKLPLVERAAADPQVSQATPTTNGVNGLAIAVTVLWWLVDAVNPPQLAVDLTGTAIMYPLYFAVRTMNVGYIMSVLAGVLIGELALRRYYRLYYHWDRDEA
jgi:copper transporter 1